MNTEIDWIVTFQLQLADKLDEIYPKGKSKGRADALVFNAYANIIFRDLFKKRQEEVNRRITDEILTAQMEGQPTSRLTSLYNKLNKLK